VITNLNDEIKNMKTLLSENEKLTENSSVNFVAKVQTISDLKQDVSDLSAENEHCQSKIHQQIAVIEELQNAKEKLQVDIQNLTSKLESDQVFLEDA
jgi:chromosome segregation ATPase